MRKLEDCSSGNALVEGGAGCPFCDEERVAGAIILRGTVFAIEDIYPVTAGHILIIPRRHTPDFFSMTEVEKADALDLLNELSREARASDPTVIGFNIGMNCGEAAGQTVMHAHVHLIPRRLGDTSNPRGGVRGVIPGKMSY